MSEESHGGLQMTEEERELLATVWRSGLFIFPTCAAALAWVRKQMNSDDDKDGPGGGDLSDQHFSANDRYLNDAYQFASHNPDIALLLVLTVVCAVGTAYTGGTRRRTIFREST